MEKIITLVIAILPIYLILLYIYKKDDNKEPKELLKRLFIWGMIICIPVAFIELGIQHLFPKEETMNLYMLFVYVLIDVALVEELFKWIIIYKITFNHESFDQLYDAIVYAVFVSLGFACFENIFYVLDSGITTGILRAVTAIPGHASDAIIMGNFLGLAKVAQLKGKNKLKRRFLFLSIIAPVYNHAVYDYCLYTNNVIFIIIFILFIIFIYIYSIKKVKKVSSNNRNLVNNKIIAIDNNKKECPKCGYEGTGNYCHKCGTKL